MKLSYTDLVHRLVDLERLAIPPDEREQGGCFSSYDRRSRYNTSTQAYEAWDANDDGSGFIRSEGDCIVAFEHAGPGVIWRCWSALPGDGHVQIFIDDASARLYPFDRQKMNGRVRSSHLLRSRKGVTCGTCRWRLYMCCDSLKWPSRSEFGTMPKSSSSVLSLLLASAPSLVPCA